jgi:hypothetical protein
MNQVLAALDATWRILLIGIVLGAGLPAMFAVGVRALAWGTASEGDSPDEDAKLEPTLAGRLVAYTMFALVILAVLAGVGYIVAHGFGMTITFNGLLPVFTPKQ